MSGKGGSFGGMPPPPAELRGAALPPPGHAFWAQPSAPAQAHAASLALEDEARAAAAAAAAAQARVGALSAALNKAEGVAQQLGAALQRERAAADAARATQGAQAAALAAWEAKYAAAVRAGRTMAWQEARPATTAEALFLRAAEPPLALTWSGGGSAAAGPTRSR